MTCDNQTIAEMLVPYVEGALAEAERLEVTEHLRHCPSCRDDARRVREGILAVRRLFASGYRPRLARHPAVEEIVAFSADSGGLSESARQNLELHLLECEVCSQEVSLLNGMHKELEGRVAPGASPLLLPRALREEVERVFPGTGASSATAQVVQDVPLIERVAALWSRFNWRPALATVGAALLLTLGFLFASSGPPQDVAVKSVTPPSPAGSSEQRLACRGGADLEPWPDRTGGASPGSRGGLLAESGRNRLRLFGGPPEGPQPGGIGALRGEAG